MRFVEQWYILYTHMYSILPGRSLRAWRVNSSGGLKTRSDIILGCLRVSLYTNMNVLMSQLYSVTSHRTDSAQTMPYVHGPSMRSCVASNQADYT